ncbi:DUF4835 family protein [Salinimicrobium soli]|uniref:type IX secretion system protein PorD n=1 Tax=Salinimicrobium soli TaxID=1254399 RepID=UPI003AB00811
MNRLFFLVLFLSLSFTGFGQELNCQVVVNAEQTGRANVTVFKTLENSLSEFINQTKWTNRQFQPYERINCSMFINITAYNADSFTATIQVQSSRPVYGSTMVSPVFNFKDQNLNFEYSEYAPFSYNPTEFKSNLISVVSFYVYTILGIDADTFEEQGGTAYYEEANQIVSTAQQSDRLGWKPTDGNASRYKLNADLLSNSFSGYRKAMYDYHRKGLDLMHQSPAEGKKGVATAILDLKRMNDRRPNSLLLRTFFDAKADEVAQVFSGGPSVQIKEVVEALNNLAPTFSEKWSNIRY